MFLLIILDKFQRHTVTLLCGCATLLLVFGLAMHSVPAALETLNLHQFLSLSFWYELGPGSESASGINWSTILFIAGMMIMVEGMAKAGFFRWMCMTLAKAVKYRTVPIFLTFMVMSAVLAMFIDSITVILFLAAVTVELAHLLGFDPVPMILSEIFCANLGGSATMCGDPPNIIIGTSLGYSFGDFITNTGLIAAIALVVTILYFYFRFHKELGKNDGQQAILALTCPAPHTAITNRRDFALSCGIFLLAVVLLITHAQTGFTVALIGVFIAALTLIAAGKDAWKLLQGIDYKTLLFFIGLFIVVGGLEETGILELIAEWIGVISGGNAILMVLIIIWVSAVASAFVDNIPFAATMIPVIRSLAVTTGVDLSVLAWSLSMGTDIGGSATPIGASANVVGTSVSAKEGHPISWARYCRTSVPPTIMVLAISSICIILRYF
ncbi:MAG: citrate transporter [Ruminiclostridium sp.]|nr:citrate transporter [Ruminiclostridium sp.]MCI9466031.1 citrate transporter [Ruminiclostridium sp.]